MENKLGINSLSQRKEEQNKFSLSSRIDDYETDDKDYRISGIFRVGKFWRK